MTSPNVNEARLDILYMQLGKDGSFLQCWAFWLAGGGVMKVDVSSCPPFSFPTSFTKRIVEVSYYPSSFHQFVCVQQWCPLSSSDLCYKCFSRVIVFRFCLEGRT